MTDRSLPAPPEAAPGARPVPGRTVRWHVVAYALAFSLPILLLVGLLLWQFAEGERRRVETAALDAARRAAVSVERELVGLSSALDVLSLSQRLQDGDLDAFRAQAEAVRARQGIDLTLRDLDGQVLLDTALPPGAALPLAPLPIDAAALDAGRPVASNLIVDPATGRASVGMATPVLRDGRPTYLLGLTVGADRLEAVLLEQGLPSTWVASVVDGQGVIMARTRDADRFVGKPASADFAANATGAEGTWIGTSVEGRPVFAAYARVPDTGWRLGVGVRLSDLVAPLRRSLALLGLLAAGLLGLSALFVVLFERRVARPLRVLEAQAGALDRREPAQPMRTGVAEVDRVSLAIAEATRSLREKNRSLDVLNRAGRAIAAELDLDRLVERTIELASELTGAAYVAFFERVPAGVEGDEELWRLFSLTGAPREAFTRFGLPRATALFGPTFRAEGLVRSDDVLADDRYGSHGGLPAGHLPVRSYLAVPVVSRGGDTLGALLFGHPEPRRFGEREERLVGGLVGQVAVAIDNARLFRAAQDEIERRAAAEAELAESNDELQRYAYIVSHDLRSPLVNVMGFTSELQALRDEMLSAGAMPPDDPRRARAVADFDEALGFIKAATAKMENLIAAILRLSRDGRRTLRPEALDMGPLLHGLVDAMRHQVDAVGAAVVIAPDLPAVRGDRLAVEQVFGNLLDNAVKYLDPSRPGRVEVTAEPAGSRVAIHVADNGRGIGAQDHGRVFELFRRAGPQDRPGEGIGLAHVKAMARAMGGRVGLRSTPGEGSTFTVWLPAATPAATPAARAAE